MADNTVEVQGPQAVHNPHWEIDHLQQGNPEIANNSEIKKLWRALQSKQKPHQDKKTSDGQSGFCWYHERDPCTFMNCSGIDQASR